MELVKKPDVLQNFLQKAFKMLNNDESKKYVQIYVIDPMT